MTGRPPDSGNEDGASPPLLEARGLRRVYRSGGRWGGRGKGLVAVAELDLALHAGETLGLVGESGCGKSTTARLLTALERPDEGSVLYRGRPLEEMGREELRRFRRRVQVVFQDPFGSLNPRMTVGAALREALSVHGLARGAAGRERAAELLRTVGLDAGDLERFPHEFSGGQRQRVGIARALSVEPEVLVADEPVSALDVSVQARILNLLADLRDRLGLTLLFIAHDLAVVRQMADRVAVMYRGRIVESGPADRLYGRPLHPYTKALLAAVPRPRPGAPAPGRSGDADGPGGTDRPDAPAEPDAPRPPEGFAPDDAPQGGETGHGKATVSPGVAPTGGPPRRGGGCPYRPRCGDPRRDGRCLDGVPPLEEKLPGTRVRCVQVEPGAEHPLDARCAGLLTRTERPR